MARRVVGVGIAVAMGVVMAVSGCSSGQNAVATLPPDPSRPPLLSTSQPRVLSETTLAAAPATSPPDPPVSSMVLPVTTVTTEFPTTEIPTTAIPTTIVSGAVVGLSADGPWHLVDSAPGVNSPGLVYELMPKLWVFLPTEESTDDGTLFVPSPSDIPIIEAYLQARLVYYQAVTVTPIDLDNPGWGEFYSDSGQSYFDILGPRRDAGEVVDLDVGVVLRPHVVGDGRAADRAFIFDCFLDGGVFRMPDGSLAPGSTDGLLPTGSAAVVAFESNRWIVAQVGQQREACL